MYYFSSFSNFETWALEYPNGSDLLNHILRFDSLAAFAEESGEIDYYETHGEISDSFKELLLAGNYNYKDTTLRAAVVLGQFMKNPNFLGPSLPIYTFPSVGSSWNNTISSHQAIGLGIISIFDKTFWRKKRLNTFWVFTANSKSYQGYYYDNKTSSVSTRF